MATDWSGSDVEPPAPLAEVLRNRGPRDLALAEKLLKRLVALRPVRWTSLARLGGKQRDRVDAEKLALALHSAGWLEFRYKRARDGTLTPTQLRLKDAALDDALHALERETAGERASKLERLVVELRRLMADPMVTGPIAERVLVQRALGNTKAVRLRTFRGELESALGCRLEELVRFHVDTVLTAGPATFRFRGHPVSLAASAPWMCLTEAVVEEMCQLEVGATRVVCIENQTPFESVLYQGLGEDAVVVFTSGFLGPTARRWLQRLARCGVRQFEHWGDLDPWGLSIYRDIARLLDAEGADLQPWRMHAADLDGDGAVKMAPADWVALHRYLRHEDAPLRDLAEAMKRTGQKLEQEALLVRWG